MTILFRVMLSTISPSLNSIGVMLSLPSVMLSEAKHLARWAEMLRFAQDDNVLP